MDLRIVLALHCLLSFSAGEKLLAPIAAAAAQPSH